LPYGTIDGGTQPLNEVWISGFIHINFGGIKWI